ncbi:hypothetical protein Z517_03774 [Fonsecaea pedrosoi CBS 271.37]|uniref:Xylanolytic transcriptional activator regulatory domain-containing protein n=1 Tax=Fonsecaea pedrosoi CBS 271.37 TaxID=1442368 RepID=A0A0D2HJC6_9EURO|nr:uncharacterized protein Z517_03774 [Fonsecaea pedrosoi CBS 271.37]KIW84524.1 hypothetical protein Z517_03774 [Fonsecaea pedrosoi CBS 271.37]
MERQAKPARRRKRGHSTSSPSPSPSPSASPSGGSVALACLRCRSKKKKVGICLENEIIFARGCLLISVQCDGNAPTCRTCRKLRVPCVWPQGDQRKFPSSKSHIKELYDRIEALQNALAAAQSLVAASRTETSDSQALTAPTPTDAVSTNTKPPPEAESSGATEDSLISRLCGRQWKLNSDRGGQYRFFGPTSSLHLTESVSSSLVDNSYSAPFGGDDPRLQELVDRETQDYLLNLYWKYQDNVLRVFHKGAFLHDLERRQTRYVSKALLTCIFASAARISDRPAIRALALSTHDDSMDEKQPPLLALATQYLDEELMHPQLTTIQSLLLLSTSYCALSLDTKGWLITGNACRLAIDLGLHFGTNKLSSPSLTDLDIEARQNTFWACIVFDRLWSVYLGRPCCFPLKDLGVRDPAYSRMERSWETDMAYAWATLLEILGHISDTINGERCTLETLSELDEWLRFWSTHLQPSIHYHRETQQPAITVLQTTILTAEAWHQLNCLKTCVKTLEELQISYPVARKVRQTIQLIMRLCRIGTSCLFPGHATPTEDSWQGPSGARRGWDVNINVNFNVNVNVNDNGSIGTALVGATESQSGPPLMAADDDEQAQVFSSGDNGEFAASYSPFAYDEYLPASAQFDILYGFGASLFS